MFRLRILCLFAFVLFSIATFGQSPKNSLAAQLASKRVTLPNGWKLSPHGKSVSLGDLPLNLAVSPNKVYIVATNNGQSISYLMSLKKKSSTAKKFQNPGTDLK